MNELKRELSRLTGIDFFSPEYREVFKKHFPQDEDAEEKRVDEILDKEPETLEVKGVEEEPKAVEVKDLEADSEAVAEEVAQVDEKVEQNEGAEKVEAEKEDIEKAEDEREIDKIEEEKADNKEVADEKHEEVNEESHEIGKKVDEVEDNYNDELLDAKLEIALLRNNVLEDKIEPAKDFLKWKLKGEKDLSKVEEILKEYPEWIKKEPHHEARGFGMSIDEIGDNLTPEERRLKQIGIEPR